MRSLYLQENCIKKLEGVDHMKELYALNLSANFIEKIDRQYSTSMRTMHTN